MKMKTAKRPVKSGGLTTSETPNPTSRIRVGIQKSSRCKCLSSKGGRLNNPSKGPVVKTYPLPAGATFRVVWSHVFAFHLAKEGWQGARIFFHRREQTRGGRENRSATRLELAGDRFQSARNLAQ